MPDVSTLITEQRTAIDTLFGQAEGFLSELLAVTNIELPSAREVRFSPVSPQTPSFTPVTVAPPQSSSSPVSPPTAPTISALGAVSPVAIPSFSGDAAPSLSYPVPPSSALPSSPGAAPTFVSPDIPVAPVSTLPSAPTLTFVTLPTPPSIEIPEFMSRLPTDDLLTPTETFSFYEAAYDATLLDPLKAKLLADLQNGGYGIDTADEVALFNRARDREVEATLSRIEDAGRAMAMRGFPLPPGELSIVVDRAYQDMQDKASSVSRDIMLERSKLFVENRQFTIEQAKNLEQILLGFHNSVQERALNVSRYTVELAIALYNSLVARFAARLDAYKAEATAFADRIRGEATKIDVYRTEVEAAGVRSQLQRTQVETYLAQLRGVEQAVNIFRIKMDAAAVHAGIERSKLDAFRAQVESYTAQVQAKVAEFGMYRAQIDGERAKVDVFDAQVRAFSSQVSAAKVQSDISLGNLQAQVENAKVLLASHQAAVSTYEAGSRAKLETDRINIEGSRVAGDNARMANDTGVALAGLTERSTQASWQANIANLGLVVEDMKRVLSAKITELEAKIAGAKFGGEKYFSLLTAMQSSINALAVQTATD